MGTSQKTYYVKGRRRIKKNLLKAHKLTETLPCTVNTEVQNEHFGFIDSRLCTMCVGGQY
jgi:hypothetical protein